MQLTPEETKVLWAWLDANPREPVTALVRQLIAGFAILDSDMEVSRLQVRDLHAAMDQRDGHVSVKDEVIDRLEARITKLQTELAQVKYQLQGERDEKVRVRKEAEAAAHHRRSIGTDVPVFRWDAAGPEYTTLPTPTSPLEPYDRERERIAESRNLPPPQIIYRDETIPGSWHNEPYDRDADHPNGFTQAQADHYQRDYGLTVRPRWDNDLRPLATTPPTPALPPQPQPADQREHLPVQVGWRRRTGNTTEYAYSSSKPRPTGEGWEPHYGTD